MCTTNDQNSTPKSTTYNPNDWLYIPSFNANTDHRYVLGTRGKNPLIFICRNPSIGVPDNLDQTLTCISNYIGNQTTYDSWIVLNLYPVRNDLSNKDGMDPRLHRSNLAAIEFVLSQFDHPYICVAWGDIEEHPRFFIQCIHDVINRANPFQPTYFCIEETQAGHPHMPLFIHIDELNPFDMDRYRTTILQSLEQRLQR